MAVTPIIPCTGVCTPWAQLSDLPPLGFTFDSGIMSTCLLAASDILFQLSGRQFAGSCQDKIQPEPRSLIQDAGRPIRPYWPGAWGYGYTFPGYVSGSYSSWGLVTTNRRVVGCVGYPAVTLGVYPLTGIEQVKIDGVVQDPATYGIEDNYWLVRRTDPVSGMNAGWPTCQDVTLDDSHKGTWSVTFDYGMPPPPLGVMACAELGPQLYLAQNPAAGGACMLPQRVTNITRQGLAIVVSDPTQLLQAGILGLRLCDMFISSFNPAKLKRRATCMTPDLRRRTARATT